MKSKLLALTSVAAVAVTCLAPIPASALIFNFSFGGVTGVIGDLADNTASQQAESVRVTSNTAGFGVGEYVGNPTFNSFTVSSGVITNAGFLAFGDNNASPAVTCCTLLLTFNFSGLPDGGGLSDFPNSGVPFVDLGAVTFTAVPGPIAGAGVPGLIAACAGLIAWRRRQKMATAH